MRTLTLKAPAKINLGLSVIRRLKNGYHEIESIFSQVSLFDRVRLRELHENEIRVYCDDKSVPTDKFNTVYQAAMLIKRKLRIKRGIEIKIEKRIPVGAGLGGGSADAAQTLLGLNKLWNLGLNTYDLMKLGKKIGMDVCYQLVGGTKLGNHLGEKLSPLPGLPKTTVVLCHPGVPVESKWAYEHIDYSQIGKKQIGDLILAVRTRNIKLIAQNLHNDFEFWVPHFYPVIAKIKKKMLQGGALGAAMTGSGSTIYGLFPNLATARRLYHFLRKDYPQTYLVKTL